MRAMTSPLERSRVSSPRSMRSFRTMKPKHLETLLDEASMSY